MNSPVGPLHLESDGQALTKLEFAQHKGEKSRVAKSSGLPRRPDNRILQETVRQLEAYFAGRRQQFDLRLAPQGTEFQKRTWTGLMEIPFGETISYAELARRIGNPKAVRAVGTANGANPISIIIPCHRVIASDGTLGGYGGGLKVKRELLELEKE
jgi:methylated-DNA-[protein]-cysteine S-methyltransferase